MYAVPAPRSTSDSRLHTATGERPRPQRAFRAGYRRTMRIGTCQTPEILADVDRAIAVVHEFAVQAEETGVDLLLFPECFLQGYLVTEEHVREQSFELGEPRFADVLARLAGIRPTLVLGLIERDAGTYHNTAAVIDRGRVIGRYRKTFLTSGESIFAPGGDHPVFDHQGVRFGINICYDLQFPQAAAAVAANGAQILLAPTQNMMPRHKATYWQHRHNEIRGRRAQETGLWIASADVTGERGAERIGLGPTGFLDPTGQVVAQVPAGTTGMVTAEFS
jgi:predicted amidohydrolase